MESLWDFSRSESSRRSEDTSVLPESHPGLLFHTLLRSAEYLPAYSWLLFSDSQYHEIHETENNRIISQIIF